jgi:sarcosine oxidase subunit gamma
VTVTEVARRRSPLEALSPALAQLSGPLFSIAEDPFRVLTDVRCSSAARPLVAGLLGTTLPRIGESSTAGTSTVLGLGERWWLVDAPDGHDPIAGLDRVSAVEVSAHYASLRLAGISVRDVLAHGTPIDVHEDHFREGMVVRTLLAKAQVILARAGPDEYRVWVHASVARYLSLWLIDASAEYRFG